MKVTIHQPEHLPWIGFFNKMSKCDVFVILDNVQYRKNYFQNRNKIMGANGPQWLTVPVVNKGHMEKTIMDIEIACEKNLSWKKKYYNSIYYSYKKYPYFSEHITFFENLLKKNHTKLSDFNIEIILYLANFLDINPVFIKASELEVEGSNSSLILNICKSIGATTYISGPSGRDYLNVKEFEDDNIEVIFNDYVHPVYPQKDTSEFVPFLSTFDLLFNVGKDEAIKIIMQEDVLK